MPLFFILSGISFNLSKSKTKKIYIIKNIMCIYVIQSLIYICLNCIIRHYIPLNSDVSWEDIVYLPIKPVAHFWYLFSLIIFYFVCISIQNMKAIMIMFSFLLLLSSQFVSLDYVSKVLFMFFFFYVGSIRIDSFFKNIRWVIYLLCCIAWMLLALKYGMSCSILVVYGAIIFSFTIINYFEYKLYFRLKLLVFLGQNSIWIYIFHSYFTSFSRAICSKIGIEIIEIKIITCSLLGIIGPILIKKILEKIKLEKIVTKPIDYIKLF